MSWDACGWWSACGGFGIHTSGCEGKTLRLWDQRLPSWEGFGEGVFTFLKLERLTGEQRVESADWVVATVKEVEVGVIAN